MIAALLAITVVLLALTLGEMRTSRERIEAQDAKVAALLRRSRATFEAVPAAAEEAGPLLDRAAPLVGSLLAARPEVEDLAARLPLVLSSVQGLAAEGIPLAEALNASDLPGLAASLDASDLPVTMASLQRVLSALEAGDRLPLALDATTAVLADVRARELPRRAEASARRIGALLRVQRRAYGVLRESLSVQRETLGHVRSIDEKLGGQIPPLTGG